MHQQWILVCTFSLFSIGVQAMDQAPSLLKVRFKRTKSGNFVYNSSVRPVSPKPISVQYDDEDLLPPDIFRIAANVSSSSSSPLSSSNSDSSWSSSEKKSEKDLEWPDLLKDYAIEHELVVPKLSSLYLMLHDEKSGEPCLLEAESQNELLKLYLITYIKKAGTQTATDMNNFLLEKSQQLAFYPHGNLIGINCVADNGLCTQMHLGLSREDLTLELFAHHAVEHSRFGQWKQAIVQLMSLSEREAQYKYQVMMQAKMQKPPDDDVVLFDEEQPMVSEENTLLPSKEAFGSSSCLLDILFDDLPLPQLGSWAEDLWNASNAAEFFIVAFDNETQAHIMFTGHSKKVVMGRYIKHLTTNPDVSDYVSLKEVIDKHGVFEEEVSCISKEFCKQWTGLCSVENCNYQVISESLDEVNQELLVHKMVHHSKDAPFYSYMNARIRSSLDDAILALKEI